MKSKLRKDLERIYKRINNIASEGKSNYIEYYRYIDELIDNNEYQNLTLCLEYYYKIDIKKHIDIDSVKKNTYKYILIETNSDFSKRLKKLYSDYKVHQIGFEIVSDDIGSLELELSEPLTDIYGTNSYTQSIDVNFTQNGQVEIDILQDNIHEIEIFSAEWINGTYSQPINQKLIDVITVGTYSNSYDTTIPLFINNSYLFKTMFRSPYKNTNHRLNMLNNTLLGEVKEIDSETSDGVDYFNRNETIYKARGYKKTYIQVTKINGDSILINSNDNNLSEDDNLYNRYKSALEFLLS